MVFSIVGTSGVRKVAPAGCAIVKIRRGQSIAIRHITNRVIPPRPDQIAPLRVTVLRNGIQVTQFRTGSAKVKISALTQKAEIATPKVIRNVEKPARSNLDVSPFATLLLKDGSPMAGNVPRARHHESGSVGAAESSGGIASGAGDPAGARHSIFVHVSPPPPPPPPPNDTGRDQAEHRADLKSEVVNAVKRREASATSVDEQVAKNKASLPPLPLNARDEIDKQLTKLLPPLDSSASPNLRGLSRGAHLAARRILFDKFSRAGSWNFDGMELAIPAVMATKEWPVDVGIRVAKTSGQTQIPVFEQTYKPKDRSQDASGLTIHLYLNGDTNHYSWKDNQGNLRGVRADGNCLFHALASALDHNGRGLGSDVLEGRERPHEALRRWAAKAIVTNETLLEQALALQPAREEAGV